MSKKSGFRLHYQGAGDSYGYQGAGDSYGGYGYQGAEIVTVVTIIIIRIEPPKVNNFEMRYSDYNCEDLRKCYKINIYLITAHIKLQKLNVHIDRECADSTNCLAGSYEKPCISHYPVFWYWEEW